MKDFTSEVGEYINPILVVGDNERIHIYIYVIYKLLSLALHYDHFTIVLGDNIGILGSYWDHVGSY